jgi:hypothetical protein
VVNFLLQLNVRLSQYKEVVSGDSLITLNTYRPTRHSFSAVTDFNICTVYTGVSVHAI